MNIIEINLNKFIYTRKMSNDDDTTGMQNPIFKIMGNQTNASMNDQ